MSYAAAVLADAPLIYWRLGEASGTTAVDASGNGNDGTYVGGPTLGVPGLLTGDADTAVTFPLSTGVYAESAAVLGPTTYGAFTVECVVDIPTANAPILQVQDPALVAPDFISLYAFGGDVLFDFVGTGGSSPSASAAMSSGTHHVAGTFDGSDLVLYVDGVAVDTQAFVDVGALLTVADALFAGGSPSAANGADGTLDEPAFYTTALSPGRVAAHYAAMIAAPPPTPTPPVLVGLSDAQIIELQFGGQRQDRFTFPLLNPDRSPLGASLDAHADSAPSVQVQTQRTSFRTCSGLVVDDPPPDLDLSRVRVQPTLTLANGSQYPLGVLMFGLDARNIYATGEQWTPELFDETFLLDQDLADTWSLGAGGSVLGLFTALADEILGPLGIPADYEIDDVAAASPLVFKVGTSRNAALVALSALLGALPPFFDNRGTYRLKPAPAGLASDHSYEIGTRIFDASTVVSSSLYKAPNRYIVVGDDVGGTPVRGVFDLPDAAGNSFASTGQRVTAPVHTVSGVKSVELATQIAYVDALTDQTTYGTAQFAAAADPRHDIFDTVTLLGVQYMETGWTLACTSGGDMSHALSRLWA